MTEQIYTFETVDVEEPPVLGRTDAMHGTDLSGTFMNLPGNTELPINGAVEVAPAIKQEIEVANAADSLTAGSVDTHVEGRNPTIVSSFDGIERETWVTPAMVDSWTERDNPIRPDAGFSFNAYRAWIHMVGGAMIWGDHALFGTPLHPIYGAFFALLKQNPNLQLISKGEQPSQLPELEGLCPESYSADEMSTGESLGTYEMMVARGIKRVFVIGYAGDFCGGSTAESLAKKGLEVWMSVTAQASVKVANYGGSGFSSDHLMIKRLLAAGVHLYRTDHLVAVNAHLLRPRHRAF